MSDIVTNKSDAPIKARTLWTWEFSNEWTLNQLGAQNVGASNYYSRLPETFISDYTKLFKWCGQHDIDAVVMWGMLRDSHGGVESAKKLCDVANENNVKLLCGVGLNAYGGVYYEGDSEYSLQKHLIANPELYGIDADGNKMIYGFGVGGPCITHHACPSRKENQEFTVESLEWLFKTIPGLGGVQMETGDTGVCLCERCRERRHRPTSMLSWEDMALMFPMSVDAIRSVNPDAFIICETYSHPEKRDDSEVASGFGDGRPLWSDECLDQFPEGVYVQWAGDRYCEPYSEHIWTDAGTINDTRRHHIMRSHHATYNFNGLRREVAFDWMAGLVQQSIAHGMDCTSIFGEVSTFHTGAELNYLALQNYGSASNPTADVDIFLRDVAAPLLGGEDAAHDYLKYARMRSNPELVPVALKAIYSYCAKLEAEPARRWAWLANFLSSTVYE